MAHAIEYFSGWSEKNEAILQNSYPLHFACRDGNVTTLALLLEGGRHSVGEMDCFLGWTPIHWASFMGQTNCLLKLLSLHATPDVFSKDLITPVQVAAGAGHVECLMKLMQARANVNIQDANGETALHKAARIGNEQCVQLLLLAGCNPRIVSKTGETAARVALTSRHLSVATFLNASEINYNGVHTENPQKENGFSTNGLEYFNSSQNNGILTPHNGHAPLNRKRTQEGLMIGSAKRFRTQDDESVTAAPQPNLETTVQQGNTSIVDHRLWCRAERGYDRMFLECMISEVHGS